MPEIAHLARALAGDGHKVYIVTASSHNRKAIKAKLYGLNVVKYYKLIIIEGCKNDDEVGQAKGETCNDNGISVFFDNNQGVMDGFSKTSKIARVLVLSPAQAKEPVKSGKKSEKDTKVPVDKNIKVPVVTKKLGKPEKKMSDDCPCMRAAFYPSRCFHCPEFLVSSDMRDDHDMIHHLEAETR